MTPERHIRANEIRAAVSDMKREIERLSQKSHLVCPLLHSEANEELRERIVDYLEVRILELNKEYEEL